MSAKRRPVTHVPANGEDIVTPSSSRKLEHTTALFATDAVTLESLARHIGNIKAQIAIMVEWLETLDECTASED